MSMSIGQVYAEIGVDAGPFRAGMAGAEKDLARFSSMLNHARSAALAFLSFQSIKSIGSGLIQAGMDAQNFKVQLEAALQDSSKAAERYQQAIKFAMTTPFGSNDTVAAIRDLSLLRFNNIEESMRGIGNLAVTFGRNMSDVSQALYTMNAVTLRQFGIQIDRVGDKWTATFNGRSIDSAKGSLEELRQSIIRLGNEELAGALEKGASQFKGAWEQFGDQIAGVRTQIMDTNGVMDYLTHSVQAITAEFEGWRDSEDGMEAMRGIAVGLRAAIDAGAAAARGFGEVLAFAAENAELLKAALLVIGGIKVFSALQASVSSWTDSWKKTQKEIIQTTLAEETRTAVANQARAAADRQKESLQSFIAELGRFRMELGMTNDEMQKLSFLRAKYDDLGAKLEGMPAPSNLDEQRELNDLTKEFYDIQEQITSFAMRQQEITSSGLSDEKERARILAEMAAARLEELNTVESIGLAIKGWIKTYGLTTALTAAISVATALIGKDISLWKNYIKQANAGLESFKHRITETQVDLENAMKAPDYDADKIGELTTKRMEEKVQALKSAYVDIRNAVANGEFRSGEMESLKSELFLAEAELKIRKKQNEEAEEKAKNEEKTAEAAKETAEALEAIEKASNITFIGDMEGEMRKYESAIRKAGKTMSAALKDARAEAQRLGVPFEDFERAIKEKGVKQIQELLDMAEKAAPELRELLEMKLGGLVLTDETGALKEAFSSLNIDKQLEQFKELREYMHIPEEAFLPQLKAMLANTTLTKDQWKKVSDMIKSATEAAKSFRNETAGKTKTALNQAQEWLKQGLISQKRFDRIAKENASAYLGGVADGLADVFSTLDLSETEMTTILLREMQGELEKAGIDAKALGKDYADLGKEMAKRMDFVSGDFGYTGKIKAGTGLDEIKKRTVAQVKLDKEAYETRMKYVKAVEASDAELARGGANAGGLPGGLEAGVQGVLQQAEQIREVLAAAFSGQAIANGMSLELQNVQSMITAMGDSLTLAATAASGHFRSMADDAGLIAERMRGALTENPLPMPDTSRDGVTPGLSGLQPQITSLQQVLTQETVTVRDLIQANTALEGRMKSLETALAKADFRTVRQEIDMDVSITSNTPAEAIREQIETNFSTV